MYGLKSREDSRERPKSAFLRPISEFAIRYCDFLVREARESQGKDPNLFNGNDPLSCK